MVEKKQVPFIFWGGPGKADKNIKHPSLNDIELAHGVKWTMFLGIDDSRYTDYLHQSGKTWLDLPISGSEYRLHARTFFVQEASGVRPYFYFWGLFIPSKDIPDLSQYQSIIEAIDQKTLDEVKLTYEQGMPTIELNVQFSDKNIVEETTEIDSIGNVLKGSYGHALTKLSVWITQAGRRSFDKLAIACNPPKEDRIFGIMLLTDTYPYQHYIIKSEQSMPSLNDAGVNEYKGKNILILVGVLLGLLSLSAYEIFHLSQEIKTKERALLETKRKLIECDNSKSEYKRNLDENNKIKFQH